VRIYKPPLPTLSTAETTLLWEICQAKIVPFGHAKRGERRNSFLVATGTPMNDPLFQCPIEGILFSTTNRPLAIPSATAIAGPTRDVFWKTMRKSDLSNVPRAISARGAH